MMGIHGKSVALGFVLACFLLGGAVAAAFIFAGPQVRTTFHDFALPTGKVVKVTACNFAWGVEHEERHVRDDCFALEYVSTVSHADLAAVDRETVETFELIRPVSELWGLNVASVSAFPSVERKGHYYIYIFTRDTNGEWAFERKPAKVFVND
jgi:hypothetical protein